MTKDKYTEFTPEAYPPFPADLPTVPLETIELARLLGDGSTGNSSTGGEDAQREGDRVFDACRGRGFFYLDLRGSAAGEALLRGAEQIALAGEETFELPLDEKMRYRQNSNGTKAGGGGRTLFGYKYVGATVTDRAGTKDTAEFFNIAKDDAVAADAAARRHAWPAPIEERADLFRGYVETAHGVGMAMLDILARRLGVDPAELTGKHRIGEPAGDHVRITRGPPRKTEEMPEIQTPSHTDFGTITILMNWLGGLQVWSDSARQAQLNDGQPPDGAAGSWLWVRPQRGCAIINLGDAAVRFTNGVLCSGRHRVVPAPGAQGTWPRYSIIYFVRPEDRCVLRPLRGPGIPEGGAHNDGEELTAQEWIARQAQGLGLQFDK